MGRWRNVLYVLGLSVRCDWLLNTSRQRFVKSELKLILATFPGHGWNLNELYLDVGILQRSHQSKVKLNDSIPICVWKCEGTKRVKRKHLFLIAERSNIIIDWRTRRMLRMYHPVDNVVLQGVVAMESLVESKYR